MKTYFCGLSLSVAVIFSSIGCTHTARYVYREGNEGCIAVKDDSNHFPSYYRDEALDLIEDHVGKNYEIVKEQESGFGDTKDRDDFRQRREWRIYYKKKDSVDSQRRSERE